MKYKVIKEKLSITTAMSYLLKGYFIRRKVWRSGVVLFTKEDYRETQGIGRYEEHIDDWPKWNKNPHLIPQFWYLIGSVKPYNCTPNEVTSKDWQVVEYVSSTENEKRRLKDKLGGILNADFDISTMYNIYKKEE